MANASQLFKDDERERLGNGYLPNDDELRHITGIDQNQENTYDHDASDLANREKQFGSKGKSDSSDDKSLSPGGLAAAGAGTLFNPASNLSRAARLGSFLKQNRKNGLIGGGIIGSIIGIAMFLFLGLIPLKIENIVQNLQKHFFATSENAVQNETQSLFENYMVKNVLPSYKRCGGTVISSACRVSSIAVSNNPVTSLYKTWANAKLEAQLATKYGIEFQYDKGKGTWLLKAPGTSSAGDVIGANPTVDSLDKEFHRADRASMRAAIKDAVQNETKSNKLFYRYKVGRLLEEKYGIKRCLIFCGVKDSLADHVAAQKQAAKLYLVQRVIVPRNQTLGIALQCLMTSCDTGSPKPSDSSGAPAENGAPESAGADKTIREKLTAVAAEYGIEDVDKLIATYDDIAANGFQKYLLTKGLVTVGIDETTAGTAADAIPVIGWVNMAATVVNTANNASGIVKKFSYVMNASAAVSLYMMYRTYADEIHTGNVNASEVGSMVNSLGSGNSGANTDPIVGGTASAEETPLYSELIGGSSSPSLSTTYRCNDGNPVPAGQVVCSEEYLGQGNSKLNAVHDILNTPGMNVFTDIAKVWGATIGKIFQLANTVGGTILGGALGLVNPLCNIPIVKYVGPQVVYCGARDVAKAAGPAIQRFVTTWLFPNPFSSNMSGGRTFDMMAAGADVAGNDSAHTTLGGQRLTPQQVADITNQQEQTAQQSFSHQSFFARMFSTNSQYSLISRLAMDIPISLQGSVQSSFASLLGNPFGGLFHNLSTVMSGGANAAATAQPDPFGVVQYGYPASSIPSDPEAYWNQYCSDNSAQAYQKDNSWNEAAVKTIDGDTGMPVNTDTNPCLLIKATTGVAGGLFNTSLLTADDLANTGGN